MNSRVTFKPFLRPDKQYAIQVVIDNEPQHKFLHWIETSTSPMKCCTTNRGDICQPIFSLEECQANCNWLDEAYAEGKIK